ncbi:ABC transporter ATP-binding protein [Affinibrenneria salicis]|uniref:ABC transporter ATP-binding protein n=1 Tax=Affinibrenneria salicis TaxID=2590031 RepID=A0A5J5G445_9GAMM|nr:ABC transporter ATP-binding protein [Affinibrenneria salicis]KAA9001790.1 ABC transporter ATP-binding protein [Affinibrenneria salicis]
MNTLHALPAAPATPFLRLDNVSRRFHLPARHIWQKGHVHHALTNVSLDLHAGEQVGLVGASGSGKSTLLKALLALEPLDGGRILCQGRHILPASTAALRWYRRLVQYIPQDPASSLAPGMTVGQLIAEPLHRLAFAGDVQSAVRDALEQVELAPTLLQRQTAELSGGQAQRVAIARAIALRPDWLLADEPVSGLDLPLRQQVIQLLSTLSATKKMGLLLVSHDISVVARLCRRTLVMHDGKIVEDRATHELLTQPAHPQTRALIAAIPDISAYCAEEP